MTILEKTEEVSPPAWIGATELVEAAGISYRQVDYWTRTGRLRALNAARSGVPRRYAPCEVAVARMLKVLIGFGEAELVDAATEMVRAGFRGEVNDPAGVDDPCRFVVRGAPRRLRRLLDVDGGGRSVGR